MRLISLFLLSLLLASLCACSASRLSDSTKLKDDFLLDELVEEEDEWIYYSDTAPVQTNDAEEDASEDPVMHDFSRRYGRAQQLTLSDLWHKHFWRTMAALGVEAAMLLVIMGLCLGVSSKIGALFLFVLFALHVLFFFFVLLRVRIVEPVVDLGKPWGDVF